LRCWTGLRYLLRGLLAGAGTRSGFMLGPDRWLSFLEMRLLHSMVRDAVQPFTPNPSVDKPAMLVAVEFIPNDRPVVEFMDPLPVNVVGPLPPPQPKERFMEVLVANEDKVLFG
jgi:hypothetical protein